MPFIYLSIYLSIYYLESGIPWLAPRLDKHVHVSVGFQEITRALNIAKQLNIRSKSHWFINRRRLLFAFRQGLWVIR